jgi:hypothetical protein
VSPCRLVTVRLFFRFDLHKCDEPPRLRDAGGRVQTMTAYSLVQTRLAIQVRRSSDMTAPRRVCLAGRNVAGEDQPKKSIW